jgi:hypothetical protein
MNTSNYYYIPIVIAIFCLYFSFIKRKIYNAYTKEYKTKLQVLKDNNEPQYKIDEEWARIKSKYYAIGNQQFYISILALSKCLLNYEDLIGVAIILYGVHKLVETYRIYRIDYQYILLDLLEKKEEAIKIVNTKRQINAKFINTVVHTIFYTLSLFFGFIYSKSKRFWQIAVVSNSFDRDSTVVNYLFASKNVISFYALFFTLYVISYRIFVEKNYKVFDENFAFTFRHLFSIKRNRINLYIYFGITGLCLLRSALMYKI